MEAADVLVRGGRRGAARQPPKGDTGQQETQQGHEREGRQRELHHLGEDDLGGEPLEGGHDETGGSAGGAGQDEHLLGAAPRDGQPVTVDRPSSVQCPSDRIENGHSQMVT